MIVSERCSGQLIDSFIEAISTVYKQVQAKGSLFSLIWSNSGFYQRFINNKKRC